MVHYIQYKNEIEKEARRLLTEDMQESGWILKTTFNSCG